MPVLSNTTVSRVTACSRAIAFLNRIPRLAPRPVPTMIAVGVARPSASGQVITTTLIANSSESLTSRPINPAQIKNVNVPAMIATSTSQKAARSASRWAGALEFCASCTSLTICASAVSEPTATARARSALFLLIVAPTSRSPGRLVRRQALAGHARLVDLALALGDLGVDGNLRARTDQQQIADRDLGSRRPRPARRRAGRPPWAGRGRAAPGSSQRRRPGRASQTSARAARTSRASRRRRRTHRPSGPRSRRRCRPS